MLIYNSLLISGGASAVPNSSFTTLVECDIQKLIQSKTDLHCSLGRDDKYHILTSEPSGDRSSYLRTHLCESSALHQFQANWLKQHPWLHYNRHEGGAYCRACVLFAPQHIHGQECGHFVNKPLKSWIKMSQKANGHAKLYYYLTAMSQMSEFLAWYENPSLAISKVIDTKSQLIMNSNHKVIGPLLKIFMQCGKQGLWPSWWQHSMEWSRRKHSFQRRQFCSISSVLNGNWPCACRTPFPNYIQNVLNYLSR